MLLMLAGGVLLAGLGVLIWVEHAQSLKAWPMAPVRLAAFEKSGVRVTVTLQPARNNEGLLTATFTPLQDGYHMYSKDLPRTGVNGVGRPTLLELTSGSRMLALGKLQESVQASESVDTEVPGLRVYPAGPVTLSLLVALPTSDLKWIDDQVSITYMACSERGCLQPVIGKLLSVKVPAIPPMVVTPFFNPSQ